MAWKPTSPENHMNSNTNNPGFAVHLTNVFRTKENSSKVFLFEKTNERL